MHQTFSCGLLEAEGAEYVFGIPCEENLGFLDSLSRPHIQLVLTPHA